MHALGIIERKRDGVELSPEEMDFFIKGVLDGSIPDYQTAAWLMAVRLRGMSTAETVELTRAMLQSGSRLDTSGVRGIKLDKHSTGGVGDKTSLVIAPILATMGVKVPMIAGRGLGHTGGTLDKLESIPGMRTMFSEEEALRLLNECGMFIMGQTDTLAPADRKLYALRDVTGTVDSIPLIAASIMSKKLSEGLDALVLDVKTGSGAFTQDLAQARELAKLMVEIGGQFGVETVALVTDMSQPLGRTVGNALEIKEVMSALRGKGAPDLMELCHTMVAWAMNMTDALSEGEKPASLSTFSLRNYKHEAMEYTEKGDVYRKFAEFIDAQQGDAEVSFNASMLGVAPGVTEVAAPDEGFVRRMDAALVGEAARSLGAGRYRVDDVIDPTAGIVINVKIGDTVKKGDIVAILHHAEGVSPDAAREMILQGLEIGKRDIAKRPLIIDTITS